MWFLLGKATIEKPIKVIEIRKQYKTKLPDTIIAATALINKLIITTRNTKDFDKIEGLDVLNAYNIYK